MPRARTNEEGEDIVLPKARARKPRAVSIETVSDIAPRKRVASRPRAATPVSEPVPRRAPTPLAARKRTHSKNSKTFLGVFGVCLLLAGVGVGIGLIDKGTIDVVAVVNERNEKINKGEVRDEAGNTVTQTIQVQSDTRPNGGLPMGEAVVPPPPPVPSVASSTEATSTPEVSASSTDESILPTATTEPAV